MGTPTNRTPVRVARGTYSNLNTNKADIQGSEIVYATDENKLYVKEGTDLIDAGTVDISGKADVASPTFTGTPAAPTASASTNTTQIATTAFVQTELGDYAPLDSPTLTGTPTVPGYAPLASPTFTGTPTVPGYAPLASPTLTGTPASTTAAVSTNTTQIATTAFVVAEIADEVGTTIQAYDADLTSLSSCQTGGAAALALLTSTEVEVLDGATLSTTELNYVDGVTSAIQTQLDAKPDLADDQSWSGAQRGTLVTVTAASTTAFDFNLGNNFYIDMATAAITTINASNATAGQSGSIIIKGHGSNTMAGWNAVYKFSGGTAPTITADAAKYDRIDYIIYDASNIHMVWSGNY